jgi:RNA polymerase sigma factor (sigma-70 family)
MPTRPVDSPGDDEALVERAVTAGDRRAFAELVHRHQGAIRAVLRRLARGDSALADDLAQSTFLRAYLTLDQFRGDARLRTWLYRIACNEFFMHRRRERGTREASDFTPAGEDYDQASAVAPPEGLVIDVADALNRLPRVEREAIIVCYYADMSHSEAAQLLGCPLGTVKTHVLRGRARLRTLLSAWAPTKLEDLP